MEAVGGDTEGIVMEWDSKVDSFDRRLELWRGMARRERGTRLTLEEIANVSFFEF